MGRLGRRVTLRQERLRTKDRENWTRRTNLRSCTLGVDEPEQWMARTRGKEQKRVEVDS